jgi:hypothetical protein
MRTLINYIRSCFCKHEWECLMENAPMYKQDYKYPIKRAWLYRCKKCGCKNKVTLEG